MATLHAKGENTSTVLLWGTQDSVQAFRLQVSDDHRYTKSIAKNIQRKDGESHRMIKMMLRTNFDVLI